MIDENLEVKELIAALSLIHLSTKSFDKANLSSIALQSAKKLDELGNMLKGGEDLVRKLGNQNMELNTKVEELFHYLEKVTNSATNCDPGCRKLLLDLKGRSNTDFVNDFAKRIAEYARAPLLVRNAELMEKIALLEENANSKNKVQH